MFERVPRQVKLAFVIGVVAAGPIVVFSFIFLGSTEGVAAVVALFLIAIVSYLFTVRKYG